jgi:hypothetical protein
MQRPASRRQFKYVSGQMRQPRLRRIRRIGGHAVEQQSKQVPELDLSHEQIGPPDASTLTHQPYDPTRDRETIRGRLAQILISGVIIVIMSALGLLALGRIDVQGLPSVMGVASPLAGVAGAAVGFYFGSEDRRRS